MKTTERVEHLVKDVVDSMGVELCDVEYQKEYGNWVLTLYVDKPGGVTIDECESVSRAIEPILDEADPIGPSYYLSVSSLGLDRPLKKDRDFARKLGTELCVGLYAPVDGKKEYTGTLVRFNSEDFTIETATGEKCFVRKDVALVRPVIHFSEKERGEKQ